MKAIITKYHGIGNSRGSHITATDNDGTTVRHEVDNSLSLDENHQEAVKKLCNKMDWHGQLVMGLLVNRGAKVWVWMTEQQLTAETLRIP